jgi:hypothetical protein
MSKTLKELAESLLMLNEGFDKPVRWQWKNRTDSRMVATFSISSDLPKVKYGDYDEVEYWTWDYFIEFTKHGGEQEKWVMLFGLINSPSGDAFIRTGLGNEFKVFATVIDVLKDFLKVESPTAVMFTSDTKDRTRLYGMMLKRLNRITNKYVAGKPFKDSMWRTAFTMIRKDLVASTDVYKEWL